MASGAGKRKTRKPARYRDEDSVDVDSASALIAKMTSEVERLESSLRDEQASLSNVTSETNTSVASTVKSSEDGDDGTDDSSERDISRPSLKELRELSKLQQRAARQRHRDSLLGAPVMHTKSRGKKLTSGLTRKAHDKVVREVEWAHMDVFEDPPPTHESLTWSQFVSGELAIINDPLTKKHERNARMAMLEDLILDVPIYTFQGIKNFYKTVLIHVERGNPKFKDPRVLDKISRLKLKYIKKPQEKSLPKPNAGKSPRSKYQYGQCSYNSDHDSPFGMKLHKCKFCIKWRPTLPADYPASSCPYNKAKRDALMASQQVLCYISSRGKNIQSTYQGVRLVGGS